MADNSDFKDLLLHLNASKARYLVVGAHAVMFYAEPRFTKDLDIWIDSEPANARIVWAALEKFGGASGGCEDRRFFRSPKRVSRRHRPQSNRYPDGTAWHPVRDGLEEPGSSTLRGYPGVHSLSARYHPSKEEGRPAAGPSGRDEPANNANEKTTPPEALMRRL